MPTIHVVKPGEYLMKIAQDFGFEDWHTIYGHPDNAAFRKKRPDPNTILPGDRLTIPDKDPKVVSCATDKRHKFLMKSPCAKLEVILLDSVDRPLTNMDYVLCAVELPEPITGRTTRDGLVSTEIPIGIGTLNLRIEAIEFETLLKVGHLDPTDDPDERVIPKGVQARLNNLGYDCGEVDGVVGPRTKMALRLFQRELMHRDPPDGNLDQDTLDALRKEHRC